MNTLLPPSRGRIDQFDCVLPQEVKREFNRPQIVRNRPQGALKRPLLPLIGALVALNALLLIWIAWSTQKRSRAIQDPPVPSPTKAVIPVPTEPIVRRAALVRMPKPPRAELVTARSLPDHWMELPWGDGSQVAFVRLLGSVSSTDGLPLYGNHLGDAFTVGSTTYAWLVAPGRSTPAWIDP